MINRKERRRAGKRIRETKRKQTSFGECQMTKQETDAYRVKAVVWSNCMLMALVMGLKEELVDNQTSILLNLGFML